MNTQKTTLLLLGCWDTLYHQLLLQLAGFHIWTIRFIWERGQITELNLGFWIHKKPRKKWHKYILENTSKLKVKIAEPPASYQENNYFSVDLQVECIYSREPMDSGGEAVRLTPVIRHLSWRRSFIQINTSQDGEGLKWPKGFNSLSDSSRSGFRIEEWSSKKRPLQSRNSMSKTNNSPKTNISYENT